MRPLPTTLAAALAAGIICGALLPAASTLAAGISPDVLVKASTPAVYYYAADGKRYGFPTEGVYYSWFRDFSGLVTISDAELAVMPLGGNVTYRPGIRMIKIRSDPKVYAVSPGGLLRWVSSESAAAALYGTDWNRSIDDVSDALFADYAVGDPLTGSAVWTAESAAASAATINADKGIAVGSSPRHSDTSPPSVAPGGAAAAGVYYVSPAGDDADPGTLAKPWRTIQYAAGRLAAGDTAYIRSGTFHERVLPQNSGQAGRLITYAAYPGETPVLDGTGVTMPADQAGLFEITDREFIKVSGLKVMNVRGDVNSNGILVDRSGNVTIEKCVTYDTQSSGIGVWSSRSVIIDGNDIELAGHGGYQESLSVAGTDDFDVRDNILRGGGDKEGICVKDGSSNGRVYRNEVRAATAGGIYVDAWDKHTHDIWVYRNVVHGVTAGDGIALASEMGGPLENVYVNNNVVYGNRYIGLKVTRNGDSAAHPMRNIQIINNTAHGNGQDWGGCIAVDDPDASGVAVRNNLCSQDRSFEISLSADMSSGNATIERNLIFSFKNDLADGEVTGSSPVQADPLFVDPAKGDFRLRSGSPAIDQGSAVGAPQADLDGRTRPQGSAVDIGAFEFQASPPAVPMVGSCGIFPADNPWNADISGYPVHPESSAYIASIGAATGLHPDFGEDPTYGIPYDVVGASQPKVPITFDAYGDESDAGPYPIPANAKVEYGSDHHVLVVDSAACKLYELYDARKDNAGSGWTAESGAVFDLRSNTLRPDHWTSADAAGLPIFPGLVRYDEVASGAIHHAIRFTASETQRAFIHPATHFASDSTGQGLPPMGLRLRLKAGYDISGFDGQARVILNAMKKYGLILADNGGDWFFQGEKGAAWDDDDLNRLKSVPGSAFEAVDTGPLIK